MFDPKATYQTSPLTGTDPTQHRASVDDRRILHRDNHRRNPNHEERHG